MMRRQLKGRLAVIVPMIIGLVLLAMALRLLPGDREVVTASERARPARAVATSSLVAPTVAKTETVLRIPILAAAIRTDDASGLAALTEQLIAQGRAVTTAQVAYDLNAAGRTSVALAYLAVRPDGQTAATWRLRFDLLRKAGRTAEASALLAEAVRAPSHIPPADIVAAGYALERPDLVIAAAASGAIPAPDATLALDLARRVEQRWPELIAVLDRATRVDWRAGDPWLALRLAQRSDDSAAALRAIATLPADQRDAAREAMLTKSGDRAGLRGLLLARVQAGADGETVAEQLLAAGYRNDAITVLRRAATGQPVDAKPSRRLLYLMGPRPGANDVAWLREQTERGTADDQMRWLIAYAERVSPAEALPVLARHRLAARTELLLTRLSLANAAGDDAAARKAVALLVDGRPLDPVQLRRLSATLPRRIDPSQASAVGRLRVAAGIAEPSDRLDLAWAAWNDGDAPAAARWLRDHLAVRPTDLVALRLMADVQTRLGGQAAARPWLERALAQTPPNSRARAELLDRLGRRTEALTLVERLRQTAPDDRTLAALQARLLIAQGQPGRARQLLAQ